MTINLAFNFVRRIAARLLIFSLLLQSLISVRAATSRSIPDFALLDLQGRQFELHRAPGKAVVLFFTGVGCPIARKNARKLKALSDQFRTNGISFWVINTYADDSVRAAQREVMELNLRGLTYLRDPNQGVAQSLNVERTAEAVVVRLSDHKVLYQGAIDDQFTEGKERPAALTPFLETALKEFLAGQPVSVSRTASHGCRITFTTVAEAETPPDYARIAGILRDNCVTCHREGGIGPWAMTDYGQVRNMSRMIEEVILTRRMPPYGADPEVGHFANAHRLTREEIQGLLRWISAGSPRGEGADPLEVASSTATGRESEWPMGKPDLLLKLPKAQEVPAVGVLEYRHLVIPTQLTNEIWLAGVDIRPSNRRIVHHAILYARWPGCPDDGTGNGVHVFGWAPGSTPASYPEGVGKRFPAGTEFTLEMHYTTMGSPQTDQTEVAFYLRSGPQVRNAETRNAVEYQIHIPSGDDEARHLATYAFPKAATVYSLAPHMHVRGKWMKFEILFPDGRRQLLLSVPHYDFKWQRTYRLAQPLKVPAGAWMLVTGAFDNSEGNPANPDWTRSVSFGLQSWEEMFIGFFDAADEPIG